MMIVPWGGGSNFCGRLLLLDLRSYVRQSMLKKIKCAEKTRIHFFRLEEILYSERTKQLNLFILSRRRLSGE